MPTRFKKLLLPIVLLFWTHPALAQLEQSNWDGTWTVEGTLFTIRVSVDNGIMEVEQVESLGFEWSSTDGVVNGNVVEVAVEYAGVTGIIQAELIDPNTAIAFAKTCLPDFMVVCVLARDRQAVFRKAVPTAP
ncbi:MAG: hypothetical protein RL120_02705 [Gammaproteobacteria bacterium]